LWKVKSTPISVLCGWRVLHDKLPTRDMLTRIEVLSDSSKCVFCNVVEESVSHVFFTCNVSSKIWSMCDKWFGVQNVHHFRVVEHFLVLMLLRWGVGKGFCVGSLVWLILISHIWKHRNKIIFKNRKCDIQGVFALEQVKSWTVIKAKFKKVTFSYLDWCVNPQI